MPRAVLAALMAIFASAWACTPRTDDAARGAAGRNAGRDPGHGAAWVDAARAGALVIDVRSQGEWDAGHVDGARHVPLDVVAARTDEIAAWLGGDKSKPVVLYCASGRRAGIARESLLAAGFTNVHNAGGLDDVRAALGR